MDVLQFFAEAVKIVLGLVIQVVLIVEAELQVDPGVLDVNSITVKIGRRIDAVEQVAVVVLLAKSSYLVKHT